MTPDHDLLIQIDTKLSNLTETVREIARHTNARIDKHDIEIEGLQKFRWLLMGGLTAVEFVLHKLIH